MDNVSPNSVCTARPRTYAIRAHLGPHKSWDLEGMKDPLLMDPYIKNSVNLMSLTH